MGEEEYVFVDISNKKSEGGMYFQNPKTWGTMSIPDLVGVVQNRSMDWTLKKIKNNKSSVDLLINHCTRNFKCIIIYENLKEEVLFSLVRQRKLNVSYDAVCKDRKKMINCLLDDDYEWTQKPVKIDEDYFNELKSENIFALGKKLVEKNFDFSPFLVKNIYDICLILVTDRSRTKALMSNSI